MRLKQIIEKNKIPLNSLEDESLVQIFRESYSCTISDKKLIREITQILMDRSKIHLLTKSTRSISYNYL